MKFLKNLWNKLKEDIGLDRAIHLIILVCNVFILMLVFRAITELGVGFNIFENKADLYHYKSRIDILDFDIRLKQIEKELKDKTTLEYIQKANIYIINYSTGYSGAGSHIKINDQSYILTCAHLMDNDKDIMYGNFSDRDRYALELISKNEDKDLALFKIKNSDNPSLKICEKEPKVTNQVMVIGNPDILEDVISLGEIIKIQKDFYLVTNEVYFGNSGGALLYRGEIIGVLSEVYSSFNGKNYIKYGVTSSLKSIQAFLSEAIK